MRRVTLLLLLLACDDGAEAPPPGARAVDATPIDAAPADASPADADVDPASWAADAPGPFSAGYQAFETTYAPPDGEERTILVNVWYPTTGEGAAPRYLGAVLDAESRTDAPAADPVHPGGHPVLLYSHGDRGFAGDAAHLHRRFASHGWVVVAPDHTGNTLRDVQGIDTAAHFAHRPLDLLRALDAAAERWPLATERLVVAGHSRGAYTTWALGGATYELERIAGDHSEAEATWFSAGFGDARVVGLLPLAGGPRADYFGEGGHAAVDVPVLWMTGTEDGAPPTAQVEQLPDDQVLWVELTGGCHLTFTLGTCPTLEMAPGFSLIERYALAFARRRVLDDPVDAALLAGDEVPVGAVAH